MNETKTHEHLNVDATVVCICVGLSVCLREFCLK